MKKLLLSLSFFFLLFSTTYSQTWSSIGPGVDNATGDETAVNAMIVFNSELYIAGCFTSVNGVAATYIAKFNGSSWTPVGNGLWHTGNTSTIYSGVKCLAIHNGELYAGGSFNLSGSTTLSNIAKWNGTAWVGVGSGFTSSVFSLCSFNNELYAGGFLSFGNNGIAKWNGSSWTNVGTGMQSSSSSSGGGLVRDMKVYGNLLYIGGQFYSGNGVASPNLITYNGTNFVSIGSGISSSYGITKMGYYQTDLVIAGEINSVNGTSVKNIARYNGTSWSAFGTGVGVTGGANQVQPVQEYNGSLIVAGFFNTPTNSIAQWDGTNWISMGTGIIGYVASLASYNNVLYAAGKFTNAGGVKIKNIARCSEQGAGVDDLSADKNISIFPNPSNGDATILLKDKNDIINSVTVYNSLGSKVYYNNEINSVETKLDLELFPAGIYLVKVEANNTSTITKVIKK